jgi:hypothetical protein
MLGCLVASIPVTSYWTALYTGRMGNPGIGSLITHLVVLFPVIYFGVSLVKRITVWTHTFFFNLFDVLTLFRLYSKRIHPEIPPHALQFFRRVRRASSAFNHSGVACWTRTALDTLTVAS